MQPLILSWQTPPFSQGPLAHSLMFTSQYTPSNPGRQLHSCASIWKSKERVGCDNKSGHVLTRHLQRTEETFRYCFTRDIVSTTTFLKVTIYYCFISIITFLYKKLLITRFTQQLQAFSVRGIFSLLQTYRWQSIFKD